MLISQSRTDRQWQPVHLHKWSGQCLLKFESCFRQQGIPDQIADFKQSLFCHAYIPIGPLRRRLLPLFAEAAEFSELSAITTWSPCFNPASTCAFTRLLIPTKICVGLVVPSACKTRTTLRVALPCSISCFVQELNLSVLNGRRYLDACVLHLE